MRARVTATMTMMALCAAGAAQAQMYASGFLHEPVGGATLGPVNERRLPVRNLGSSGQDGVEIKLRTANGGGAAVDLTSLEGAAPGSEIKIRIKGWDGTIKGTLRMASNGDGSHNVMADLSPMGATSVHYADYDSSGTLVDQGTLGTGGIEAQLDCPPPKTVVVIWSWTYNPITNMWSLTAKYYCYDLTPHWPEWDLPFDRQIVITPVLPPGTPVIDGFDAMVLTGDGLSEFDLLGAELGTFGVRSWGLGQAHVTEECPGGEPCGRDERRLPVRNLGSSGQDGVAIDLGSGGQWSSLRSKRCPDCPPGHVTLIKLYDDAARLVSEASVSENPGTGSESVAVDFSPIGAAGGIVECLDGDGQLLASIAVGGVAVIDWGAVCPPGSYPTFTWWKGGWIFTGCVYYMDITLPGGTVVPNVHSVSFRPLGPLMSYGPPRQFAVTDTGPGSEMVIENVTVGRCDGDVDRDGDVDQDDLDVILFNFGTFPAVGQNGDVDGDGDVDQDDLDLVLFNFGCV